MSVCARCLTSPRSWKLDHRTKAVLDALSASDDVDTNHDGVISMSELTAYIKKH